MCKQLDVILMALKTSTHNTKILDQISAQTITSGLIHITPTWNCLIRAYSKSPDPIKAILIYAHFTKPKSMIIRPDNYTYPGLFGACSRLLLLSIGKQLHAHVVKAGMDYDIYIQNSVIHFYGSTAQFTQARFLFDLMPQRDLASWNVLLSTYSSNTGPNSQHEVLILFKTMLNQGIRVDRISLGILLSASSHVGELNYYKSVHAYVIKAGFTCILSLNNSLLSIYTRFQEMDAALRLFNQMLDRRDNVTYTIMINGYIKMGSIDLARSLFDHQNAADKDLILWNSMIHGYVKVKRPKEALHLFAKMVMKPDEITITRVLGACASLSYLQYGRVIHRYILQNNVRKDVFVGTSLLDMYFKCGALEDAMVTFYKMAYKDGFTWTAVIEGLANHGQENKALSLFDQMEKEGTRPNEATFCSVLKACKRLGMVIEGCCLVNKMVEVYKIKPKMEHIGCLIDLMSRAGYLDQVDRVINIVPLEERVITYKTLLNACMNNLEIDPGNKVADKLIKLGSSNHAVYVLLSNFYASIGGWPKVEEMRKMMKEFSMRKEPGISSIGLKE